MTRSSILFICNTFCCWLILLLWLSSLYIELALVCCTNPDNVQSFGTIFPNLTLFLHQSVPPVLSIFNPTNTEVAQLSNKDREQPQTRPWLWVSEMTWYLYTRGVRVWMKAKQRWFKVTRELCQLCHEWFHQVRQSCSWQPLDWRIRQPFDVYTDFTVSQSRSVMTSMENPAPKNLPQSIGELRNGHVANLQELLYHTGSKNGVI